MPAPSRDRLPRPVDISTLYSGARRRVNLIVDEPGLRWAGLGGHRARGGNGSSSAQRVDGSSMRTVGVGAAYNRRRVAAVGQENRAPPAVVTPRVVARRRRSILPSWYPRRPLGDITHIVNAIERRRAERRAEQAIETPAEVTEVTNNPSASTPSSALLEHDVNAFTPLPAVSKKSQPTPTTLVLKIMDQIAPKENSADSEFITPQKRLLNSIDKVREVWLAEQKKFEKTPAAKRAQREQKVRVLMSMR